MSTLLASDAPLTTTNSVLLSDPKFNRCLIGSLRNLTRPNISYVIHHVYQFMQNPQNTNLTIINCIFCYLKVISVLILFELLSLHFVAIVMQIGPVPMMIIALPLVLLST